jgi:gliding motility-associated-like protein
VVAGSNSPVCEGDDIFLTSSISGATYLWTHPSNGFTSTLQNPVITNSTAASSGTYAVTVTNIPGGCPGTSNSTTVAINTTPITPPISSQNISGNTQDVCIGSQLPYAIEPATPGSEYSWNLNGGGFILYMATSDIININWTTPGTYTLSATETTSAGCNGIPVTLTINVNSVSTASVAVSPDDNPVCTGTLVTITASPVNQGTSPGYTWYKNGIQAGAPNLPTYTFIPDDGDQVYVELSSSSPCALPNPVASNSVTFIVNSTLVPAISISASSNPVCSGGNVDFTSTISNGGINPDYQWLKNGLTVGTNSPTYSDNTLVNSDLISCTLHSDESCASPTSATSNLITMNVNPIVSPSITVSADINPSCSGDDVTFTAITSNGGNMPVFEWQKNGLPVGSNSPVYNDNLLNNNDIINCTLLSNASCASSSVATGNPVIITVNPVPVVSGYSLMNPGTCGGTDGTISVSGLNASTLYDVNYNFNGTPVTRSLSSDGSGILVIPDLSAGNYSNIIITLNGCNSIPFDANLNDPGATAAPALVADTYSVCPGETVTLTASGCSGDITWSNGATGTGISVSTSVTTTFTATCTLNGCTSLPSNPVEITVKSPPLITNFMVTNPTTWCVNDGLITLYGLIPNTFYSFSYTLNVVNITGSQTTDATGALTISGCEPATYFNISAGLDGCFSDSLDVLVGDPVSPQVPMVSSSDDTICPGETVTLSATGCNGLVTWSDGSTGNTLSATLAVSSAFFATCTESACTSAPGNSVSIVVGPAEISSIEGNNNICLNGEIQLSAIGNAISYDWVLPDGNTFSGPDYVKSPAGYADSGIYILNSKNISDCTDTDSVRIMVNIPAEVSITSDKDLCAGNQQNLQAGEGFSSYLWNDGSTFSTLAVRDEGQYWVTVTDARGCEASDTTALSICAEDIYIPNAFSPNRDGDNEVFRPVTGSNVLLDYSIIIYNRWGQLIYESDDYAAGWNGTLNGKDVQSGLYTYVLRYSITDLSSPGGQTNRTLRGTFTLVR